MKPHPRFPACCLTSLLCAGALGWASSALANEAAPPEPGASPAPVTEEDFSALSSSSPFLRSVGSSDSIVLTGMARIGEDALVTVVNTETKEARLVSSSGADAEGWQVVDVRGDASDLDLLTAKVQISGGEVISIRYEEVGQSFTGANLGGGFGQKMKLSDRDQREARYAAYNYRKGFSSDGFPNEPPREIVIKLERMNVQQRERINQEMIDLRNRGLGQDQRRQIYINKVNGAAR